MGVAGCMDFTVPVGWGLGCICGCWVSGAVGVWGAAVGCVVAGVLDVGTAVGEVGAVGDGVTDGIAEGMRDGE
ncbi:hypothetical protein CWC38_02170 [Kocuria tytonicola]|nr:hypothetical protein CWC38_02170 [Kocuria tytonicola]